MASNEPVDGPVLTVVMDGQAVIEYDRSKPLASRQRLFLDHMDRDMDSASIWMVGRRRRRIC